MRGAAEFLVEARSDMDAQIVCYIWLLEAKDKSNHLVADSLRQFPHTLLELNRFHQVKRMIGGIGNVLFSTYFLRQVRTLRGRHQTHTTTSDYIPHHRHHVHSQDTTQHNITRRRLHVMVVVPLTLPQRIHLFMLLSAVSSTFSHVE